MGETAEPAGEILGGDTSAANSPPSMSLLTLLYSPAMSSIFFTVISGMGAAGVAALGALTSMAFTLSATRAAHQSGGYFTKLLARAFGYLMGGRIMRGGLEYHAIWGIFQELIEASQRLSVGADRAAHIRHIKCYQNSWALAK